MKYFKSKVKDYYLLDTDIENIFISEYMIGAPGDYVKIYFYALMYANLEIEITNEEISQRLLIAIEDVLKAWTYWEGLGVVKKHYINKGDRLNYKVEFLNLREQLYGKGITNSKEQQTINKESLTLKDEELKDLFTSIEKITGRLLGGNEPMEIINWVSEYDATPELIVYAYSYCVKSRKKDNVKYVGAVVREWIENGITTPEKIEEHLTNVDKKHFQYKRVLKALGFSRNATEAEKELMDKWFIEMNFSMDKVLEACAKTSGIPNPNMNYVNKILCDWKGEKSGGEGDFKNKPITVATVLKYYDYIRGRAEKEAQKRKQEIYEIIPRIKDIDMEMRTCSMGISKIMISGDANKDLKLKEIKKKADKLNEEKLFLLTENNYEITYLDAKYSCMECRDTGTNDKGEQCECFSQRFGEAEQWQNSLVK